MDKKEHYSKRLKRERDGYLRDIYAILDGDLLTITTYMVRREVNMDFEKTVWFGNTTTNEENR